MNNNKNKVAIISSSLGIGGAERFASTLSFILHDLGYEVHSIIINKKVDYDYKGELFNLGIECENAFTKKIKKAFLVKQYLDKHDIDIVIDNRTRLQFIRDLSFKWIYGNRKCFYMVHSSKLEMYLPKSVFLAKMLYSNANNLICVSKEIQKNIKLKYNFENTTTIYNSIKINDLVYEKPKNVPMKYFLFFGRFDEKVKNLSLMIESFLLSKVYESDYYLILMGNGTDKEFIKKKIKHLKGENFIKIIPFDQPIPYIKHARSTVLTSRFEGFPMSIIESLAFGIPVISVDCPSGPKEIITNEFNGLIVENNNKNQIADAFKRFAFEEELYQICKLNSQKSVAHLSIETITEQWKMLLNK